LANGEGVSQNIQEAAEYLKMSADQRNPGALLDYGLCPFKGLGVAKDFETAAKCFRLSAEQPSLPQ
jgi:TPR repeat protein